MKTPFSSLCLSVALLCSALNTHAENQGLANFRVTITGHDVKITWTAHCATATTFEVQVATEADLLGDLNFTALAELPAGNTTEYEFTDNSPDKEGIRYYRVKQLELNGKVSYTETATANFQVSETFTLNVTTTTGLAALELGVNAETTSMATVTLTSLVTTYTQSSRIAVTTGSSTHTIPVDPNAPNGPYLLSFEFNGLVQLRLVSKQPGESMIVNN
jgi:hypothetical protein